MKCPICKDVTLLMADKKWVEIDYCPECRWVWLDRWELEKLMQAEQTYNQNNFQDDSYNDKRVSESEHWNRQNNSNQNNYQPKKKKSFLDMLDFWD